MFALEVQFYALRKNWEGKQMARKKLILGAEIVQDLLNNFWSYILLVLVLASAFSVIYFSHLNRQTTIELEQLLTERDQLDVEYRNLVIEQNVLAETSEVEQKAMALLSMKRSSAKAEVYVEQ